jgi:hypothetical protein
MDFLKKHYEKIILSLVLLGLVGALVFLPVIISSDQQQQKELSEGMIQGKHKALQPLDLSDQDNVLQRLKSPYNLDFSTTNKLFNPMQWQKAANGYLIKIKTGSEIGGQAAVVTKITPLYLILTLDSVETNALVGARYVVGVERQASPSPSLRHKRQHYVSKGEKNDVFTLTDVKGDPANPDQLVLKLTDTSDVATISKDKPFQRVDGYAADLQYDPEGKKWQGQRVGADLKFASDDYIIVAIHQNEVILSAASNQKKNVLPYAP